ncbi:MAG: methyltransferase, FkbM family [Actinomycetia bacterium]|nr:methyltransferase, FkbM family [Actinomycetes bacterium]
MNGEFARLAVPGVARDVEVCLPEVHDAIAHELRIGAYELPAAARLVLAFVTPGARVLDLGAHLGTVALAAAARGGRVLAIEASPRNATCLEASARRNGFDLTVRNVAVGDRAGAVRFHEEGPYGRVASADDAEAVEVTMLPASALVEVNGWDGVDVVKIDVEGYELVVLDGLRPLLTAEDAPPVVFEANRHVLAPRGIEPSAVVAAFADLGYETYFVGEGTLVRADVYTFQPETVADYLAIKPGVEKPWPVRDAPGDAELASRVAAEAGSSLPEARAALGGALATAPRSLLAQPAVERALEALTIDADASVANAASWWPAWRHGRAARRGSLAAITDGWRALADSATALTPEHVRR